jgi:hypothetical protein
MLMFARSWACLAICCTLWLASTIGLLRLVVVRACEVVDRFASSLYLITTRVAHLTDTAAAQHFPPLFVVVCSTSAL